MMLTVNQDGLVGKLQRLLLRGGKGFLHRWNKAISIEWSNHKRNEGRTVDSTIYSAPAELH